MGHLGLGIGSRDALEVDPGSEWLMVSTAYAEVT